MSLQPLEIQEIKQLCRKLKSVLTMQPLTCFAEDALAEVAEIKRQLESLLENEESNEHDN